MEKILKKSVIDSLKENGISVDKFYMIYSGRNSLSWKIKNDKRSFFLKKYIYRPGDLRDRLKTENNFLRLLKHNNIENVPEIICYSKKHDWSILSWMNGDPIKKPNSQDWDELLHFQANIQKIKQKNTLFKINNASEAFFDICSHANFIEYRIRNFLQQLDQNKFPFIKTWIEENLLKVIDNYLLYRLEHIKEISLNKNPPILSQSDIGFHNAIKYRSKLYFFDFEYSGWDDPYKQYADLVIQPENVLNYNDSKDLLDRFSLILNKEINFNILREYIFLYRLKWVIIILKQLYNLNNSKLKIEEIFFKATSYYNLTGSIWLT